MKKSIEIVFAIMIVSFTGCQKDDPELMFNQNQISESDVIGRYEFKGYTGDGERTLNLELLDDHTGSGTETCEGVVSELRTTRKYIFEWAIKNRKVVMKGVSATINTSYLHTSISWRGSLEYAYGMLVPGDNFIKEYAETAITDYFNNCLWNDVTSEASFDQSCGLVKVTIKSQLDDAWKDMYFKYGLSLHNSDYTWGILEDGEITFTYTADCHLYYTTLLDLVQKEKEGKSLSISERNLEDFCRQQIKEYASDFIDRKAEFSTAVNTSYSYKGNTYNKNYEFHPLYKVINSLEDLHPIETGNQ